MVKLRQEWTQVSVFNNISNIPVLFGQLGLGDNTRHFIFSLIIISQLFFTRQKSGGKKPWTGLAYPPFYLSLRDFGGRNKQWGDATACLRYTCYRPALSGRPLLWLCHSCVQPWENHTLLAFATPFLFCKTGLWTASVFITQMFKGSSCWTDCPTATPSPKRSFSLSAASMTGVIFSCWQIIANNNLFSKNGGSWRKCLCIS